MQKLKGAHFCHVNDFNVCQCRQSWGYVEHKVQGIGSVVQHAPDLILVKVIEKERREREQKRGKNDSDSGRDTNL